MIDLLSTKLYSNMKCFINSNPGNPFGATPRLYLVTFFIDDTTLLYGDMVRV